MVRLKFRLVRPSHTHVLRTLSHNRTFSPKCNTLIFNRPLLHTMSTRASKRQKTESYELIYWPGIPGRGEHVRLAFEASGTAYKDVCVEADNPKAVLDRTSTSNT